MRSIEQLEKKHSELKKKVQSSYRARVADPDLNRLKKQKLLVKDQLERTKNDNN